MQTVQVGDGHLAVDTRGTGEPVLLVHGAMVADSYGPMLATGDLDGYQTVTYRRRGFQGSSSVVPGHTIADEAADAIAVLDVLGIESAHVVGHSYGGVVALQMALDRPGRIRSLGLFEPALLSVPAAAEFGAGVAPAAEAFASDDHPGALMRFLTLVGGPNPMSRLGALPPEATEQALADIATLFTGDLQSLSNWAFDDDDARSITQPAFLLLGTDSADLFQQSMAKLEDLLPTTESYPLAGASHFLQMEKPAEVAGALSGFLSRR